MDALNTLLLGLLFGTGYSLSLMLFGWMDHRTSRLARDLVWTLAWLERRAHEHETQIALLQKRLAALGDAGGPYRVVSHGIPDAVREECGILDSRR